MIGNCIRCSDPIENIEFGKKYCTLCRKITRLEIKKTEGYKIKKRESRRNKYATLPFISCPCKKCGTEVLSKIYEGAQIRNFCDDCSSLVKSEAAIKQKDDLVLLDLKCKKCGVDVKGYYGGRGKTCEECIRKSGLVQEYKHYKIHCIKCQVEFECGRSDRKYCEGCRKERSNLLKRFRRSRNPEKYRSEEREYKKKSLMGRTTRLNSRARKYGKGNLSVDIIKQVFQIDNFTCVYCNKRGGKLTVDHMVPLHKGGNHEDSNLVTACFTCNNRKRTKMPLNFICELISKSPQVGSV